MWQHGRRKVPLKDILDQEDTFTQRPYIKWRDGYESHEFFYKDLSLNMPSNTTHKEGIHDLWKLCLNPQGTNNNNTKKAITITTKQTSLETVLQKRKGSFDTITPKSNEKVLQEDSIVLDNIPILPSASQREATNNVNLVILMEIQLENPQVVPNDEITMLSENQSLPRLVRTKGPSLEKEDASAIELHEGDILSSHFEISSPITGNILVLMNSITPMTLDEATKRETELVINELERNYCDEVFASDMKLKLTEACELHSSSEQYREEFRLLKPKYKDLQARLQVLEGLMEREKISIFP
ncbi:uncharacterized protein G2W53_027525 [Senna tora]|uniref:Uncharacterized protein n=1 Tax=Senna tora TaxID=362788 RepID=A0A834TJF1_9FABA|nr:uncharacterized protein G2W53_027525 [Senna tora]